MKLKRLVKLLKRYLSRCLAMTFSLIDQNASAEQILINNVNVFDGTDDELAMGQNVLVDDNLISAISSEAIDRAVRERSRLTARAEH